MSDATVALEVLDLALVPGSSPSVYVVGMSASRITLADQQRRAVNIIWALLRERRVKPDQTVAIVGGGIAGITAAAYAIKQGLHAAVFEKFDDPFALQQGSGRWLHPNIYDWPTDGWNTDRTSLPCMNWRAGMARDVVAELRKEWHTLREHPLLDWKPATEIVSLDGVVNEAILIDAVGRRHGPYACVVLAAGFGEEAARPEFDGKPYWRDDDLHQRLRIGGTALVSGCGDGGLIEAIRVALRDFRHDWLATVAVKAADDKTFVSALQSVERDTPAFPDGQVLTHATLGIAANPVVSGLIKAQLRPNTSVILNAGADGPFTRAACLINRVVVAELIKLGVVRYVQGKVDLAAVSRTGTGFEVSIEGSTHTVDVVVVRHGPEVRPLARFASIDAALAPARTFLRTYRAGVDRSRVRAWGPIPAAALPAEASLPPSSTDVMDYLGQSLQNAFKDELAHKGLQASVGYESGARSLELRVRIGARQDRIKVALDSGTTVTLTCLDAAPEPRTLTVTLAADVMVDAGSAVPALAAKVPDLLHWIVEGHA